MVAYIIRRLLLTLPVFILLSIIVFAILYAMPGDPAVAILGENSSQENLAALREELGLNRPVVVQYASWAGKAVRGNFGRSLSLKMPVTRAIADRLPVSLELLGLAIVIALIVGLTAGVTAALHRNSPVDLAVTTMSISGIAMPDFWLGILLMLVFGVQLRLLPVMGFVPVTESLTQNLRHLILPASVLGIGVAALVARYTRSEMLEALGQDYVRTARAKGLRERVVVVRHVLKNALIPVVTLMGIIVGRLFSGMVVLETLFALPGVGRLTVNGVFNRDYPLVQGAILFIAFWVVLANLLVDIAYGYLDPRIRRV